jgi:hypothetical protein
MTLRSTLRLHVNPVGMKARIISDVHSGSRVSRPAQCIVIHPGMVVVGLSSATLKFYQVLSSVKNKLKGS